MQTIFGITAAQHSIAHLGLVYQPMPIATAYAKRDSKHYYAPPKHAAPVNDLQMSENLPRSSTKHPEAISWEPWSIRTIRYGPLIFKRSERFGIFACE